MALTCDYCLRGDSFRCKGNGCANSPEATRAVREYRSRPRSTPKTRAAQRPTSRSLSRGLLGKAILDHLRAGHALDQIGSRLEGAQSPVRFFEEEFGHEHAPFDPYRRLKSAVAQSRRDDKGFSMEWVRSRIGGGQMPAEFKEGYVDAQASHGTPLDAGDPLAA